MNQSTLDSTTELLERCRRNERQAQHQLYQLYCDAMFNTAIRMMGSSTEAEDVLQESFVAAFSGINSLSGESTFGAWLKRIVLNKCADQLRKKTVEIVEMTHYDTAVEDWEEEEGMVSTAEVQTAMKSLPDRCRAVFNLYMLEGYDHEEIGQILKVSISTSKSQLHRARKLLRERIQNR